MYQKRNKDLEIIALFTGDYKRRLYLRQIHNLAKLPLKTVQNILAGLEKNSILKSKVEGKNKYFSLNLDNINTKSCLLQAEIHKTNIFLDKYSYFKHFLKDVTSNMPIIIFGSFAKFSADKNSDIDMLIILEKEKEQKIPFHLLPNKVHKMNLSEDTFVKSLKSQEAIIKEIEENHIILNNHSFFVNVFWNQYDK